MIHFSIPNIVLFTHGRILCWGSCSSGRCGRDVTDLESGNHLSPLRSLALISFSDNLPALFIGGGSRFFCAIFANERLRCWGLNSNQELGDRTTVSKGLGSGSVSITRAVYVTFAPTIDTIPVIAVDGGRYAIHFS